MNDVKTAIRRLLLSCVAIFFTLLLLEVALRVVDVRQGRSFFPTHGNILAEPFPSVKPFRTFGFDPYRKAQGVTMISDTWRRDFALEKPAGTYRIVCFGGSTTAHRMGGIHYPRLLQQKLRSDAGRDNIEVINVGSAAYATPHSIILLALDVLSWQPDLVILSHNINDLLAVYFPGIRHDYWNKYQNDYYAVPDFSARYSWNNVLFQHSRLYWFGAGLLEQGRQKRAERNTVLHRQIPFDRAAFALGKDIFQRNVRTFVKMAQAADLKVILGTQSHEPSEAYFMRHMAHKPYNDVAVYPSHAEHIEFHAAYNTAIREVAEETGAILVDNELAMQGRPDYFIDHVHNSSEGLRVLAQHYGEAIMPLMENRL